LGGGGGGGVADFGLVVGGGGVGFGTSCITSPHQTHDSPSFGIPVLGMPKTVPQPRQVIVALIVALYEDCGEAWASSIINADRIHFFKKGALA
jgi:hypothetical protein